MTTSAPVPALDRDLIARLRFDVIAASWTTDTLETLLSDGALSALMRDSRLPALVELAGVTDPAATVTGKQGDLRIDLVATTSIPGDLLKQRMQALAGHHWELRDVR